MKIELPFNQIVYNKQMDLLFDLAWKKHIEYYKNSHYFGFLLLVFGPLLIIQQHSSLFGYVLIFSGLGILIPYFYYYFKIKSIYKRLEIQKDEERNTYRNQNFILEFTEEHLITKTQNHEVKISWKEFLNYLIKEDNLILITKTYEPIILGEIEVGKEQFKCIIDLVTSKINK